MKHNAVRASVDRILQSFDDDLFKQKEKITAAVTAPNDNVARRGLFEIPAAQGSILHSYNFNWAKRN